MTLEATLTVDLDAIAENWRALDARSGAATETAAVVKADAYGLGIDRVAPALAAAGARTFFVALAHEGARLREILGPGAAIHVLGGYLEGDRAYFEAFDLRPVLNSAAQVAAWFGARGPGGPAAVQVDTGMNRLGLERSEFAALGPLPEAVTLVMSHLACADDPGHGMNADQRAAFETMTAGLGRPRALAATGGTLLGADYHYDMTRPGIGLFGGAPFADARPVATLEAPIVQVREVLPGEAVGYGATWRARRPARIATVSTGYADGVLRAASNSAHATLAGRRLPYAGRVSMDLITLDATHCPEAVEGARVALLGPDVGIDALAAACGTIGYEILTALGARYARRYVGG